LHQSNSPFLTGYFWDRILLYVQADLDCHPSICASLCSWDDRRISLCLPSDWLRWGLWTFCPGWPWTKTSTSQIVNMIGLSHHASSKSYFFREIIKRNISVNISKRVE
jgi:hypothetical protein